MMKEVFCIFLIGYCCHPLMAQMVPNSSQPFQYAPSYNPAFAGIDNYTSFNFGYRSQWSSFPGAPKQFNLVGQCRVVNAADIVHNALRAGTILTERDIPRSKRMYHGLSGSLIYETTGTGGLTERMEEGLSYAVHIPLRGKVYISTGAALFIGTTRIRWDLVNLDNPNDGFVDRAQGQNLSHINARVGGVIYGPHFYVHGAYLQLSKKNRNHIFADDQGFNYISTFGVGGALHFGLGTQLKPAVSFLIDDYNQIDADYSLKIFLQNGAWGGMVYRDNGFLTLLLGFEFSHILGVGYSYETATGGMKGFNNGSNEIIISVKIGNFKKSRPYLW